MPGGYHSSLTRIDLAVVPDFYPALQVQAFNCSSSRLFRFSSLWLQLMKTWCDSVIL